MVTTNPSNQLSIIILAAVTLFNIGILVGLLLNLMPLAFAGNLSLIGVAEFVVVFLAYQYGRRKLINATFEGYANSR